MSELQLLFRDKDHVAVCFGAEDSGALPFRSPLTPKNHKDLSWYLEVYGAHSLGDPDDHEARRIAAQLPVWGKALFVTVFGDRPAQRLFNAFQDADDESRVLTISTTSPSILALPWELLCDPARGGSFLFNENPRISIRRRVAGVTGGHRPFKVKPKDRLHLLFVVSRPEGSAFLDPRADPAAVLDALDSHAPTQFTWDFLRPPTLEALIRRIDDGTEPDVDILHFDGHGIFDPEGGLPERLGMRSVNLAHVLSGTAFKHKKTASLVGAPPNTGYLEFETPDGLPDLVSAERLGFNLHRRNIPLVILSACQSSAQGNDEGEPLGSVAARLTAAGIPAVLAMSHSVLVHTTRTLFGEFYKQIARHRPVGEALDAARLELFNHPEKYQVQRGPKRVPLMLHDWFVPSLYQAGDDLQLIQNANNSMRVGGKLATPRTNLPHRPEAGFFGRKRELWDIERWFADKTRRITISGFGGQGKTALALEATRWLTRTGMFQAAVFVDYSRIQAADAVAVAVSNLGSVLGLSLIDGKAARDALEQAPTLLVLDNLEALASDPLRELLDAAKGWSEAGSSRVLLTTRMPDLGHPNDHVESTLVQRRIVLDGLGDKRAPDDALEWFAELSKLPPPPTLLTPQREELIELFDMVKFHPLSILVLAAQLKTRPPWEIGQRFEQLLTGIASESSDSNDGPVSRLVASLMLSLDRLDTDALKVLPQLGVFQGGAFEDSLLAVTGLGDPGEGLEQELHRTVEFLDHSVLRTPQQMKGTSHPTPADLIVEVRLRVPTDRTLEESDRAEQDVAHLQTQAAGGNLWTDILRQLQAAAIVQLETISGVKSPFVRFHPTLSPMLWEQLRPDERAQAHDRPPEAIRRARTSPLPGRLAGSPLRGAVALLELPNLLRAVHGCFDSEDPDAVDFANCVTRFLKIFGFKREADRLAARRSLRPPSRARGRGF